MTDLTLKMQNSNIFPCSFKCHELLQQEGFPQAICQIYKMQRYRSFKAPAESRNMLNLF